MSLGPDLPLRQAAPSSGAFAVSAGAFPSLVDDAPFAGYENAIHANGGDVWVAYKRFTADPRSTNWWYTPAELRVARSTDAGETWSVSIVDAMAADDAGTNDRSVAIGGVDGLLLVVYGHRPSGAFADAQLKVARSTDGGATWEIRTIGAYANAHLALAVVDTDHAYVSAQMESLSGGLRVFRTTDGGATWTDQHLLGDGATRAYTAVAAPRADVAYVSHYRGSSPPRPYLEISATANGGQDWTHGTQRQVPATYVGLGNDLAVAHDGLLSTFEEFSATGSVVRFGRSVDGGATWSFTPIESGNAIGSRTGVSSPSPGLIVASWWSGDSGNAARLGISGDGGASWMIATVSTEPTMAYMDSASTPAHAFVSYLTLEGVEERVLKVARKVLPASSVFLDETLDLGEGAAVRASAQVEVPRPARVELACPTSQGTLTVLGAAGSPVVHACAQGQSAVFSVPVGAMSVEISAAGTGAFRARIVAT